MGMGRTAISATVIIAVAIGFSLFADAADTPGATTAAEPFHWARIQFALKEQVEAHWNADPASDTYFLRNLKKNTNINVDETWHSVALTNVDEMAKYPLLFMTAEGRFDIDAGQSACLKEYLQRGGFIYADDCVIRQTGDHFFTSCREIIEKTFGQKMVRLPDDHELYHCLYDIPGGAPFTQGVNHGGWAFFIDGRMAVFLTPGDIHCGWASKYLREQNSPNAAPWFPPEIEDNCIKMGINVIVYAMTH